MFYVKYTYLAPYNSEQMFNLVNDISSYTKFVPGCNMINILEKSETELIAEIDCIVGGIVLSIVTHNFFIKNKKIMIVLTNSPFKLFYGSWKFIPVNNITCNIEYFSYYEFKSIIFEKFFNYILQKMYKKIIKTFIVRANEIYRI